mmetsp:Transcript_8890/g.24001  ORF Transcript_8890/g.24001 Transcript_8890/m.24001 type:complete len:218 (+) Transcript_8890:559-1212(+)
MLLHTCCAVRCSCPSMVSTSFRPRRTKARTSESSLPRSSRADTSDSCSFSQVETENAAWLCAEAKLGLAAVRRLTSGYIISSSLMEWNMHTLRRNLCRSTSSASCCGVTPGSCCSSATSHAKSSSDAQIVRWMWMISLMGGRGVAVMLRGMEAGARLTTGHCRCCCCCCGAALLPYRQSLSLANPSPRPSVNVVLLSALGELAAAPPPASPPRPSLV